MQISVHNAPYDTSYNYQSIKKKTIGIIELSNKIWYYKNDEYGEFRTIGIAQNTRVDVNAIAFRDELRVPDTYIIIYDRMN